MFPTTRLCSPLLGCVPHYLAVFPTTRLCSPLLGCVPHYLAVFPTTWLCSPLLGCVPHYSAVLPLIPACRSDFVYDLFEHMSLSETAQGPGGSGIGRRMSLKRKGGRKKATVSSQFKDSLHSLMTILGQSNPYFVRCIKPNMMKVRPCLSHVATSVQPSHLCGLLSH